MNELRQAMEQDIKEAELVLVGLGDELEEKFHNVTTDFLNDEKWKNEFLKANHLQQSQDNDYIAAYNALYELIKEKNYFIVTTCKDGYIFKSAFAEDRIVAPCGNYRLLQCEKGCNEELQDAAEITQHIVEGIEQNKLVERPKCTACGENLVFNNIYAEKYLEKGYMPQWEIYTKWLQGTINRKVCIIELGVGLAFPTVIRWPFEKVAFYNNKARFYRVHSSLYQLPKEICEKGKSCDEDALSFLLHLNNMKN